MFGNSHLGLRLRSKAFGGWGWGGFALHVLGLKGSPKAPGTYI